MVSSLNKKKLSVPSLQMHFSAILDAYVSDLDHCQKTDLSLIVSDPSSQSPCQVQVHQSILLPICPLLGNLIRQDESVIEITPSIILADVSLPTLQCLLTLVYTGKCIVSCDDGDLQILMQSLGFSESLDIATDTETLVADTSGPADNPSSDIPQHEPDCDTTYTSSVKTKSPVAKCEIKVNIVDNLIEQRHFNLPSSGNEATACNAPPVKAKCLAKPLITDPKYNWSCHFCQKMFKTAELLTVHALEKHNTLRPFHCSYCKFSTKNNGLLKRHQNIHTRAKHVSCDVCGKIFLCNRDLDTHRSVHTDQRNVQCEHCDKCFKSDFYLRRHLKLVLSEDTERYNCKVCDKVFKMKDYLKRHFKKVHGEPKVYLCSFCGKSFKSASNRKDHEIIHLAEANAECKVCGYQVRKRNLNNHMKIHSEEADFQCDICAKLSITAEALKVHMNIHKHPFKCEYCRKTFSTNYSMKAHTVQQHLSQRVSYNSQSKVEKPLSKCDQCDFQCQTKRYLKSHKAVKHEGLVHECQDCNFITVDLSSLRSHRRAKHEGVSYSCDQCEFTSGYKSNLRNHKAVSHFIVNGGSVLLKCDSSSTKLPQ